MADQSEKRMVMLPGSFVLGDRADRLLCSANAVAPSTAKDSFF